MKLSEYVVSELIHIKGKHKKNIPSHAKKIAVKKSFRIALEKTREK